MNKLALWIAELGPIGRIKYAPGTLGSLAAIPLILISQNQNHLLIVLFLVFVIVGIWSSDKAAKTLNVHDPSTVVIDEVCGMLTTFLFVSINWHSLLIGFVCFRFFDVFKIPPIQFLEKVPGGAGIVLDDIGAGLLANLILQLIFRYVSL